MSLASLGNGKQEVRLHGKPIVRHVPIEIEGAENMSDNQRGKKNKSSPSYEHSKSLGQFKGQHEEKLETKDSMEDISKMDKIEDVVKTWLSKKRVDRQFQASHKTNNREDKNIKDENRNKCKNMERRPFSEIKQVCTSNKYHER